MGEKPYKGKRNDTCLNVRPPDAVFPPQFLQDLGGSIRWLRPQRVIIFGSAVKKGLCARDIDVLVVAKSFGRFLWQDRPKLLYLPPGPVYDLRLFTPAEFEAFYPLTNPFRQSMEAGINLEEYYA